VKEKADKDDRRVNVEEHLGWVDRSGEYAHIDFVAYWYAYLEFADPQVMCVVSLIIVITNWL
jgi:hypothetical protein